MACPADPDTGVDLRARFDYLPDLDARTPTAVDLKTNAKDASAAGFAKTIASYGYDIQQEFYERVLKAADHDRLPFVFLVVETEAPYLVGVHRIDVIWERMGAAKVQRALELHAECSASGVWPGYPDDVQLLSPPMWLVYQHEDEYEPDAAEIRI